MTKNHLYKILSRIVEIKPGEETISFLLFLYFFLFMAPYYIIKPYRDAKYLIEEGSINLPIAYLSTAIIMGFFVAFYSRLQVRIRRNILIISSLIFFTVTTFLSREFFIRRMEWIPLVFWIWANIYIIVLITQFWLLVNDVFNPREAKRLIGFFGSGGLLGGILGGLLTGLLGRIIPDYLLLIAAGMLVASIFVVNYIFIWQRKRIRITDKTDKKAQKIGEELARVGFIDCFHTVRKNYYLTLLAAVVTLTFIVATFIDYQSKTVIRNIVDRMPEMTSFFGYFHAGLLVLPFFLQLLITSNLIKRYGIRFTLLLFPFILLLCSIGIFSFPALLVLNLPFFALVIKGSEKSLSFSLNQSVRELLYIPISPNLKNKAKLFIDMFLNRFAKGIGALILMVFIFFPPEKWQTRVKIVSIISVVFILGWLFFNLKVSKEYTNTVKQKLELKWERADRLVADKVDMDYTKLVFDTLESKERSSVLYAMHLFDLIKQDRLTPEVKKLISYKSDEMRVSSLGGLFEGGETTLLPEIDEYIGEEDWEKEIKEIMSLDVYQELMRDYVDKVLVDKSEESETAKMEVAKALGLMGSHSLLVQKLEEFLLEESPEVSKYAIESSAKLRRREHVPSLIQKLESPLTREDACVALEKYGSKIVGTLADYLADSEEKIELRKAVTSVLARVGTQEAADFLSWELAESEENMDNDIIDALDRIRSERADVEFQEKIVKSKISKEIKAYYQIIIDSYDLKPKQKRNRVSKDSPKKLTVSMMNIFKLLGLIYPREDIFKAYHNITAGTEDSVDYAIELLDNMLKKEIKDILFPIVEDISLEERVKRCRSILKASPLFR